jgi:putative FmdB family regulatory protein
MPLYEYLCDDCGHRFERIQKFSDKLVEKCPKCRGRVRKLQSAPAIQFKGSGFYITDYAKKEHTDAAKADSESADTKDAKPADTKDAKPADTAAKTEAKTETKAEAKRESKKDTKTEPKTERKTESKTDKPPRTTKSR